jgi:multidrug transporter EmrE-like cation transporter
MTSTIKTILWITSIVIAELIAFALLQTSVDSPKHATLYITISILLFGLVVPIAFRETLKGNKIAVSNMYWIIASQIGSVILGYWLFQQHLSTKEYIAIFLLILATLVLFVL